jgi:hypothetical protein
MKKFVIFLGAALAIILALAWTVQYFRKKQTKSFSPEETVSFNQGDLKIKVFYNRPYKKGREIFGGLVPFDKVWRTGANEASTFETNKDLSFENKILRKGKYSLWTIPRKDTWTVIFNMQYGQWGIKSDGEANHDPQRDALSIDVPVLMQDQEFEQFTIAFEPVDEDAEMVFMWDKTLVSVPFSFK